MNKLSVQYRHTDSLIPYARNARTHSAEQVAQLAGSIREFGFCNPVLVDEAGGIIAGHGRVLAAQKLKMAEVPTITLAGLTETQKRAYVLADNRLAANAGWDAQLLAVELEALASAHFDATKLGFTADEIQALMADQNPNFEPASPEEQGKLDQLEPKPVTCPECGHTWDLRADAQG